MVSDFQFGTLLEYWYEKLKVISEDYLSMLKKKDFFRNGLGVG